MGGKGPTDALAEGWATLRNMNLATLAKSSGAIVTREGLDVPRFASHLIVSISTRTISEDGEAMKRHLQILVLHYLLGCSSNVIENRDASFAMLPSGSVYASAFDEQVLRRIATRFGAEPELLVRAGRRLGGMDLGAGDSSIGLRPFPRLPAKIIVWRGDDEIPANASFLFDRSASDILPAEDLFVLAKDVVERLVRAADIN